MTRYFTFTNDNSNKFWQIDTDGTAFTVAYGKAGTTGQSQTKTFDTAERCQQEADKLIREKTGKGYVESVGGVVVESASAGAAPRKSAERPADFHKAETEDLLNRYDEIIRDTLTDQLLPFLQSVDKRQHKALGQKVKLAKRYWCDYVELDPDKRVRRWGYRGSTVQRILITLSGMALLNQQELKTFEEVYNLVSGQTHELITRSVLEWAKPRWLTDFLAQQAKQGNWATIPYSKLRELESAGLVDYHAELFARSVTTFRSEVYIGHKLRHQSHHLHLEFLTTNAELPTREIPAVFAYSTDVHLCTYRTRKTATSQPEDLLLWPLVFEQLLTTGKLDRSWFLEQCLSVQTKDWNTNLRAFYRKQFEAANPAPAELASLQSTVFALLGTQHPHVVSWAIGLVKTVATEADFRPGELLDWAPSVMMRDDCKTGLKTLLSLLERLMKTQPNYQTVITHLLADVFVLNDLPLQTKAASLLTKYGNPTDTDLRDRLQTYSGQMLGNVAGDLKLFLTRADTNDQPTNVSNSVAYEYAPKSAPKRTGQAVRLPATWTDFVFLIGRFIGSDDPLDGEILINALILLPADLPADFREQLKPYEKQLGKIYGNTAAKYYLTLYLQRWLMDISKPFDADYSSEILTLRLQLYRLQHIDRKRRANSALPLLSLPTHAPHWIAPKVLIERLLAYQRANEPIDALDLAIAIARMPREETAEALVLSAELDESLAPLMRYCLGATEEIGLHQPTTLDRLRSAFQNDTALTDRLKTVFGNDKPVIEQQALWAVAARTFGPDSDFPVFADVLFAALPNVQQPFVPAYNFEEKRHEWKHHQTNEVTRGPSWQELTITFPEVKKPFRTLLYSNDLSYTNARNQEWKYYNLGPTDALFWNSLIPQQPEALFTIIAKYGCKTSDTAPAVGAALTLMLEPGFRFRAMSRLVLICGLLARKREMGALAAEVLIHHFGEQTLDAAQLGDRLGWLLAGDYAPVQRLIDALHRVRDVSPLHNKALLLTLDGLFAQLTPMADLPKNTKKLLEIYLDLLIKLGENPAEATARALTIWQEIASLKRLCTDILKLA